MFVFVGRLRGLVAWRGLARRLAGTQFWPDSREGTEETGPCGCVQTCVGVSTPHPAQKPSLAHLGGRRGLGKPSAPVFGPRVPAPQLPNLCQPNPGAEVFDDEQMVSGLAGSGVLG